ncbi:TonB-dependent siderophore receptor [Caballeronia humi]|uniref:TonB-dependent siderophore receptor n=1 Tax=Caballeronia humi TaxID=326474 RepID=A0A158GK61_9BURK|nr:TonB-dependent siderophore receptor [Caballeronia humi]
MQRVVELVDNVYVQDGESVFQGIETGGDVQLGKLDGGRQPDVDRDTLRERLDEQRNRVAGAPGFVAAAHVNYAVPYVPALLRIGADAKFTGSTTVRPSGDLKTPGHMLVNLGATYATRIAGHVVAFRAAIDNLTNRRYWEFQYADYIAPGEPRTLSLNARLDF